MKIQIGNEPYLYRPTGLPIEGRLTVYKLDTDVKAQTYTLEGTSFVQAENPVLLHSGLPDDSLFVDLGLYTVAIERYTGPEGQMSVETPDEYFEKVDQYEVGLDFDPQASSGNVVDNLAGLMDAATELRVVTVLWHDTPGDCVPRTYIWDGQSQDAIDGGYVIGSDHSDTGRWILLWGDEVLPCTVYGVTPGNEGNLNSLLNYPAQVGSFHLKTAPCVRFLAGTYTSTTSFSTEKGLCFDRGAKFLNASFTCPSVRTFGGNNGFLADFTLSDAGAEAHSSWFRSIGSFWICGAHKLILDPTNYFTNNAINGVLTLDQQVIEGHTRLPATYNANSYLLIVNCTIVGDKIFSPSLDRLRFRAMEFKQSWMTSSNSAQYDFGQVSQGHRLQLRTTGDQNIIRIENFPQSPNTYLAAVIADGQTSLDGQGRTFSLGLGMNTQFTSFKDFTYDGSLTDNACAVWEDVNVTGTVAFGSSARTVSMTRCNFALSGDTMAVLNLGLTDCNVRSGGNFCPSYTAISVNGGTFQAKVELSDNAKQQRTKNKSVSFSNCTVDPRSNPFWLNSITMRNCTSNAHIYLVPYKDGNEYGCDGVFEGNHFILGALIEANVKNPATEYMVYAVKCNLRILDNRFDQEDARGIVIPRNTPDYSHVYVGTGATAEYKGNTGNCPREHTRWSMFWASSMTRTYGSGGSAWHYLPENYEERVWNLNVPLDFTGGGGIAFEQRDESWDPYNLTDARTYVDELLHIGHMVPIDAKNDQFLVCHGWQDMNAFDTDYTLLLFGF